ncbi:MAG TPA: hypothetical protein V6D15_02010 [Oculatellaceae cyanobacterium]|jgi:hypothetical protein
MATNNKPVSVYLPKDLEQYLTEYCTEYSITRKDKMGQVSPAWGTAIVEILKHYFTGDKQSNIPGDVLSTLPDDYIQSIKEEIRLDLIPEFKEILKLDLQQLQSRVEELEKRVIAQGAEEVEVDTQPVVEAVPEVLAAEEEAAQKLESLVVEVDAPKTLEALIEVDKTAMAENLEPAISSEPTVNKNAVSFASKSVKFNEGLTGAALAQRLGRDAGGIVKHHKKGDLAQWSQSLDPDSIAWERRQKLYFPVDNVK